MWTCAGRDDTVAKAVFGGGRLGVGGGTVSSLGGDWGTWEPAMLLWEVVVGVRLAVAVILWGVGGMGC